MPRILCLTSNPQNRAVSGAAIRSQNIFRMLADIGPVKVVLASAWEEELRDPGSSFAGVEVVDAMRLRSVDKLPLKDRFRQQLDRRALNTVGYQATAKDVMRLKALMADHDLVWIYNLAVANAFGIWRWPYTVLDFDDIPSCVHRTALWQASNVREKIHRFHQMLVWRRRETTLLERFDAICAASEGDRNELRRRVGHSDRIHVVPNGFAKPKEVPARRPVSPPWVGFIGTFKYGPNRDGAQWFIKRVWPNILKTIPQARLRIVGEGSEEQPWPSSLNIDALGWLEDTESEMAKWSLTVVPIFVGGGTRVKTAEAFSRKCPVVSTTLGVYGYDVLDGREALITDSAAEFAAKCLRILSKPHEGETLADKAWEKFLENWTWDSSIDRIARIVDKVSRKKPPAYREEGVLVNSKL